MVVAPLVSGDEVFGALGTFSSRADAFSASADRAGPGAGRPRRRGDEQRPPDRGARRVARGARRARRRRTHPARDRGPDQCRRRPPGGPPARTSTRRPGCSAPTARGSTWSTRATDCCAGAYASGAVEPGDDAGPTDPDETVDQGVAGQAVVTGRAFWTGDYLSDTRFSHLPVLDEYIEGSGIHSVMAAPLTDEGVPFGALTVFGEPRRCVERDGRRAARGDRRPGRDHDPDTPPDRRAGPLARGARPERRRGADAARDRRPVSATARPGRRSSRPSSTPRSGCSAPTGAMIDLVGDDRQWPRLVQPRRSDRARSAQRGAAQRGSRSAPEAGVSAVARCAPAGSSGPAAYLEDERFRHTAGARPVRSRAKGSSRSSRRP